MKIQNPKSKIQKGAAIYLALVIMIILLAVALGLTTILIGQIEMMRKMGYSVIAFYAADAGIERVLMNRHNPTDIPPTTLPNGATYQVFVTVGGAPGCDAPNFCIKSIGEYKGIRRAIEISY